MSHSRHIPIIVVATALLALWGSADHVRAAEPEALAVIVHRGTPVNALSGRELEAIFSQSMKHWKNGSVIVPLNYSPGTPLRATFDRTVLGMEPDMIARFWIDRRIRGYGDAPRKLPSPSLMLRVVSSLRGCIGYVPAAIVDTNVKVVAIVVGGRVTAPGDT